MIKKLLHVGPAVVKDKKYLGPGFQGDEWEEIRLDVDPMVFPDILNDMNDMKDVADNSMDAVYTSHTIEHLYPDDVKRAMEEIYRVLKPEGFLVITCPDLQSIGKFIAEGRILETLYMSEEGPITPIDIIYGFRGIISRRRDRRESMSHRTGFTLDVMLSSLRSVGFPTVVGRGAINGFYSLWVLASKQELSNEEVTALANEQLP